MSESVSAKWCGVTSQVTASLAGLGVGDHVERAAGGEVRDVEARAGGFGEHDVAGDHDVFARSGNAAQAAAHGLEAFVHVAAGAEVEVLAVIDDGQVEGAGELHGAAHDAGVHDGAAVVGDGDDAGGLHGADGGELLAGAALGDGADGEDVDDGGARGALDDVAGDVWRCRSPAACWACSRWR